MPRSDAAAERSIAAALGNPALVEAALALHDNRLHDAEPLLKARLKTNPFDVAAIRMLAELAGRIGRYKDAEKLLRRALELAPGFGAARANLATLLHRQHRSAEALAELEPLVAEAPDNLGTTSLKAAALGRIGGYDEAIALYERVLEKTARQPKVWMSYAHLLKTVGRQEEAVVAYRRALDLAPSLGEVWWSLANLKTVAFAADDIATMQAERMRDGLSAEDAFHLDFALGKAFEDLNRPAEAFRSYEAGNRGRRALIAYDSDDISEAVDQKIAVATRELFASRPGGCPARDPIFVLGMPRAGSTLIEQILSSHSMIEGTSELSEIAALAQGKRLTELTADERRALGESYIERTRIYRKTDRPFFIDKMPNNWAHVVFIQLCLPNATIVDARRHPLGCCWSNYKQHFARGQAFSYALDDLGRYYRDYVRLMAHVDAVLPGRVHRVIYERMVDDTETEVRALLAACGLDFEDACLRFHENARAVRTASSEQVRRPIFREGVEGWTPFESWLGPLKTALGDVLPAYPEAPASA